MNTRPGLKKTATHQELLGLSLDILDIEVNDDDDNTCPLLCACLFYVFLL